MQVQAIQNYNLKPFNSQLNVQKNCPKPQMAQNSIKSIYSHGMSGISFGSLPSKVATHFEREIAEQPAVLRRLFDKYFSGPYILRGIQNIDLGISYPEMCKIKRIHLVASGSSKNSAEMAQGFIENIAGIPVNVESASEFMYKNKPLIEGEDLAVFISQSGGTADTLAALNLAKSKGAKTIAITNKPESKIAQAAGAHIPLEAGEEQAVAATKTVTSSIFNLMAMGLKLGEIKGIESHKIIDEVYRLKYLPEQIEFMLKHTADVKHAADILKDADNIYYYAKGSNVGAVKEGALKLTETTGKRVIADASGEALHGTFASIRPENPVLQVAVQTPDKASFNVAIENIKEMVQKRHIEHPIILRNTYNRRPIKGMPENTIYLNVPETSENISPILTTVKFQQLTNEITKRLGINPDNGGGFLTKFRENITMK